LPELPEVETIVRDLARCLVGKRVTGVEVRGARTVRTSLDPIIDQSILSVSRHGKVILVEFERDVAAVQLGMTGRLLIDAEPGRYCQAVFEIGETLLLFEDVRQFGRVRLSSCRESLIEHLGPDALSVTAADLIGRLRMRKSSIKPLLLNQGFLAGLGNIYVDEILHAARIHPSSIAASLSASRTRVFHERMREILAEAIRCRGSSISDYVDASGQMGSYQLYHRVYAKAASPCQLCGTPICRIVVAQRGTHYCPECQRL
jgi:formamidopyrimidine-DNA glycosylase